MLSYESLGSFYLGREYDAASGEDRATPLLYDSRDLTTHAVCLGMTGSGKTGLCLSLLEEAAIDGIPTIAIDPKGDLSNLLLTFPELRPEDFAPWIDAGEAARQGMTREALAAKTAETWRNGLSQWDQDGTRIRRFREAAEVSVYTPGSDAGLPLSVLRSFAAPRDGEHNDATALRDRIAVTVSGLLGLIGVDANPIQSREHILLSSLFAEAWSKQQDLDLATLVQQVQKPAVDKIGVLDLETFFPAKDRVQLALRLNNLLASPGFAAWMHGAPLDIQRMLYRQDGKPRISIVSIAHLNDAERMFVVTLVLAEVVAWMRRQSGTSSLRALLYMDEIFGYFPPSAMPPAKLPLLTLMKQARAFGLGVVLATQNPVDLDYKGLSNAGTWFIGRLQTERDKARLIEGLLSTSGDGLEKRTLETLLANLGNRVFLMRNVHDDAPVLFRTRWALSYLRGPLTLQEIAQLSGAQPGESSTKSNEPGWHPAAAVSEPTGAAKPPIPPEIREYYWPSDGSAPLYSPYVLGRVRVHFIDKAAGVDEWQSRSYLAAPPNERELDWSGAEPLAEQTPRLESNAAVGARYAQAAASLLRANSYERWRRELSAHMYRSAVFHLFVCPAAELHSGTGESEAEFRARLVLSLHEKRDAEIDRLRNKYAPRAASLEERLRRAHERIEREAAQLSDRKLQTAVSVGTSLLGALLGRKAISATNAGRLGSAARNAGRIGREREDVKRAEESREAIQQQQEALERELQQDIENLRRRFDPSTAVIEPREIKPRKSDLAVEELAIVWRA